MASSGIVNRGTGRSGKPDGAGGCQPPVETQIQRISPAASTRMITGTEQKLGLVGRLLDKPDTADPDSSG